LEVLEYIPTANGVWNNFVNGKLSKLSDCSINMTRWRSDVWNVGS
jgi:hypothetical protein